jgi:glycosyltransferase involved in cell wall biosynthesis
VDAVRYFLENILEFIVENNPLVNFDIIGRLSERYKSEFQSRNVKVIGGVNNLDKAISYYKLLVCPMTYGAGMKGKIGSAMAAGVPIVTTPVGAEGFAINDGEECFIAESPVEFAAKCNRVLSDPIVWQNFSVKSRLLVAKQFSPPVVAKRLGQILSQ